MFELDGGVPCADRLVGFEPAQGGGAVLAGAHRGWKADSDQRKRDDDKIDKAVPVRDMAGGAVVVLEAVSTGEMLGTEINVYMCSIFE